MSDRRLFRKCVKFTEKSWSVWLTFGFSNSPGQGMANLADRYFALKKADEKYR
ncbi:MAG: hypothetical protein KBI39_01235 [Firmicutes bacterium]|nr:hypothetical protein [Candidatus Fermentithermobacillaceae bacterium]